MRFKGTHQHYNGEWHTNSLMINPDAFEFSCGFFDVYDNKNKRVKVTMEQNDSNTPQLSYYTQRDNSGGLYEMIKFNSYGESWYSNTIIGNNRVYSKEVSIQTWDRKELFISFTYEHKATHHGRIRATSEVETCIFTMDDRSASEFAAWLESVIAQRNK